MQTIIMAVDDEEHVLSSLGRLFRNSRYHFVPFHSPVNALNSLKKIKPHIIISDQRMPLIHGSDFLSRAKTISQRSLRIMLTGYTPRDMTDDHHIDRVMMKPWDNDELEHQIMATTIHHDKIFVKVAEKSLKECHHVCGLCGHDEISHELRFDQFTEHICCDCHGKFMTYAGSPMESMLIGQMIGNVI